MPGWNFPGTVIRPSRVGPLFPIFAECMIGFSLMFCNSTENAFSRCVVLILYLYPDGISGLINFIVKNGCGLKVPFCSRVKDGCRSIRFHRSTHNLEWHWHLGRGIEKSYDGIDGLIFQKGESLRSVGESLTFIKASIPWVQYYFSNIGEPIVVVI